MRKLTPAVIDATLLTKLQARTPAQQKKAWNYTAGYSRTFKDELTSQLVVSQSKRCAYCGGRLHGAKHHRDHVAPKEVHGEFTFIPENLVLACYYCNTECKGAIDTIAVKNAVYASCAFSIIHPYLDEPSDHIRFVGGDNAILIQVANGSVKGDTTIKMFGLDSPEMTIQRVKDASFDADCEHLPGNWIEALEIALTSNIKIKPRAAN